MIASLPMYLTRDNRAAHDAFWTLIRDALRAQGCDAPEALDHEIDHVEGWGRSDLVLGQICNLPYRAQFRDRVTVIGAADYGLEACPRGYYRSLFIARKDDPRTNAKEFAASRFVYSDPLSQSGYGAAQVWADKQGFLFQPHLETGGHRASIKAVADEKGDIAAIDAQTWRIAEKEGFVPSNLKVIGATAPSPGMTFITRKGVDPAPHFRAIETAITQLSEEDSETLNLKAIISLPSAAYDLPFPPTDAAILA